MTLDARDDDKYAGFRLLVWLWRTQRNGHGPHRLFGLDLLDWGLVLPVVLLSMLGYWLLFRLFVAAVSIR